MSSPHGDDAAAELRELRLRVQQLETREADRGRLMEGVERLSDETAGLNTILNKVDEQQQRLSTLGRDLERVEKSKASKDDLEVVKHEQEESAFEFRKKALKRIYTTALLIVATFGLVGGAVVEYEASKSEASYKVCIDRNEQNAILLEILQGSLKASPDPNSPAAQNISMGIERLESLIIDCEDLK